jgi:hypothetical protein
LGTSNFLLVTGTTLKQLESELLTLKIFISTINFVGSFVEWRFGLVFFNIMATGLTWEDRLEGVGNFCPWKTRIILLFQENELWDIVESTSTKSVVVDTDATTLAAFNKKDV